MILWGGLVLLGWGVWAARIEGGLEVLAQQTLAMHPEAGRLEFGDGQWASKNVSLFFPPHRVHEWLIR